jgi:ADP-ribosylglycohydrolase
MNQLYDKVLGCIAASHIGSAMGGPVENMLHEQIKEKYGMLDRLIDYPDRQYNKNFPAGSTEDGIERQKLLALSIIENQGPITARDFGKTWMKYVNEESFGKVAGLQDEIHYRLLKAGIPPEDCGYYDAYIGRNGFNRASHPIGIINACFPQLAARNALDVARIFQPPTCRGIPWKEDGIHKIFPAYFIGIDWAASVCAAIAEAFKPQATIDSVVEQSVAYVVETARNEILGAVAIAKECSEYEQLVEAFNKKYRASGFPLAYSRAYETVSKGIALFYFYKGDVKQAIIGSVNFGRDTDCLAAIAAGIAGAFSGASGIPREWIETVNSATAVNEYTVTQMTIEQLSKGLYDALVHYFESMSGSVHTIESLMEKK